MTSMDQWEGLDLPAGYWIERDADLLLLRHPDGTPVAAFSVRGVDPAEVTVEGWNDARAGAPR